MFVYMEKVVLDWCYWWEKYSINCVLKL